MLRIHRKMWENWIEQEQMYPPDFANGLKVPNSGPLHVFSNVPHPIFVGNPEPLPPEWIRRDFAWSLLLACPPGS